jgi:hypothetical protein
MTITLTNPNPVDLTGVGFNDTYQVGLVNATPSGRATTCGAGTVTAADGGGLVALLGGTIPANSSCTVTVNVTSVLPNTYTNTIPAAGVTTTNGGASGVAATATLVVNPLSAPTVTKAFAPTPILIGQTSVLTITLANANAAPINLAGFTDTYPANLVNAACARRRDDLRRGNGDAAAGGGTVTLANGTIPANGNCTVTVTVTSNITAAT